MERVRLPLVKLATPIYQAVIGRLAVSIVLYRITVAWEWEWAKLHVRIVGVLRKKKKRKEEYSYNIQV